MPVLCRRCWPRWWALPWPCCCVATAPTLRRSTAPIPSYGWATPMPTKRPGSGIACAKARPWARAAADTTPWRSGTCRCAAGMKRWALRCCACPPRAAPMRRCAPTPRRCVTRWAWPCSVWLPPAPPRTPMSRPSCRLCETRCWPPSRTTTAPRWPPSWAPPRRCRTSLNGWTRRNATAWPRASCKRPSICAGSPTTPCNWPGWTRLA